jgi:hypothetical protein
MLLLRKTDNDTGSNPAVSRRPSHPQNSPRRYRPLSKIIFASEVALLGNPIEVKSRGG